MNRIRDLLRNGAGLLFEGAGKKNDGATAGHEIILLLRKGAKRFNSGAGTLENTALISDLRKGATEEVRAY